MMQIKKSEASRVQEVNSTYPPKCVIEVRPDNVNQQGTLDATLSLIGTDDGRKFKLTNPQICTEVSAAAVSLMSPTRQEPQKS